MSRQCAARHRYKFFCGQTPGDRKSRYDEKEPGNQHVDTDHQVVPGSIGADSGKSASVVAGPAGKRVEDFGESMRPAVVEIPDRRTVRAVPISILGKWNHHADGRENEKSERRSKYGDDGHLDFLLLDLLTDIFGRAADHQSSDEHGDQGVN